MTGELEPYVAVDPRLEISGQFQVRPLSTDRLVLRECWAWNQYELDASEHVAGRTVIDIGANIGAFTVWAVKAGAKRVVAFEPQPANCARLIAHVAGNIDPSTVELLDYAVTGENGDVCWDPPTVGNEGNVRLRPTGMHTAKAVTLADVLTGAPSGLLVKIDVEGSEYEMFDSFDSAPAMLWGKVDRIVMEWHVPPAGRLARLLDVLMLRGRIVSLSGHPTRGGLLVWTQGLTT